MTTIIFTLGLNDSEANYVKLANDVQAWWTTQLNNRKLTGYRLVMMRFYDDIQGYIAKNVPVTDKLVLVGFSYGGGKTIDVANALNIAKRAINGIVLIDPVVCTPCTAKGPNNDKPNITGFAIPGNVKQAWAFFRGATQSPWSSSIASASGPYVNTRYINSGSVAAAHGMYVWQGATVDAVVKAAA